MSGERADADWLTAIDIARRHDVEFIHPERGLYHWTDVVSSNLHDALHHKHDIQHIRASPR